MRPLILALLAFAASAQAQTQCTADRQCVTADGYINASVSKAPSCSVTSNGETFVGSCAYQSQGTAPFGNGYSETVVASGQLCSALRCVAFTAEFTHNVTRIVSGRLAGRVQSFWWVDAWGVQ